MKAQEVKEPSKARVWFWKITVSEIFAPKPSVNFQSSI